ncbi:flavin reductase family protein [Streptomyces sp. NBC_01500]|uniref:flavin reductase family protein n=1 Tax=Streptomyces sp. NBC_01500 TaxID=2903886 RepID=UPI002257A8EF|nr:flavin reductase family protein [Streptomyces sp. NBC_01500]MCX4552915.1 flavin reductase family protein [Streptomyces sp. NBC_01500]
MNTSPATPSTTDTSRMREVLSAFCTGVAVITAIAPDGSPAGMAVQSFTPVSLDPPLVAFCPALTSSTWPKIRAAGRFTANILAADQQDLCRRFAVTGGDKFTGARWAPGANGAPVLDGVLATVECDLHISLEGGDHAIALGRVTTLATHRPSAGPLLYFRRRYGRFFSNSSMSASIASASSHSAA